MRNTIVTIILIILNTGCKLSNEQLLVGKYIDEQNEKVIRIDYLNSDSNTIESNNYYFSDNSTYLKKTKYDHLGQVLSNSEFYDEKLSNLDQYFYSKGRLAFQVSHIFNENTDTLILLYKYFDFDSGYYCTISNAKSGRIESEFLFSIDSTNHFSRTKTYQIISPTSKKMVNLEVNYYDEHWNHHTMLSYDLENKTEMFKKYSYDRNGRLTSEIEMQNKKFQNLLIYEYEDNSLKSILIIDSEFNSSRIKVKWN